MLCNCKYSVDQISCICQGPSAVGAYVLCSCQWPFAVAAYMLQLLPRLCGKRSNACLSLSACKVCCIVQSIMSSTMRQHDSYMSWLNNDMPRPLGRCEVCPAQISNLMTILSMYSAKFTVMVFKLLKTRPWSCGTCESACSQQARA